MVKNVDATVEAPGISRASVCRLGSRFSGACRVRFDRAFFIFAVTSGRNFSKADSPLEFRGEARNLATLDWRIIESVMPRNRTHIHLNPVRAAGYAGV